MENLIKYDREVKMDDLFNNTWFLIPNWKWLAIVASIIIGFAIKKISRSLLLKLKTRYTRQKQLPMFVHHLLSQNVHFPFSWLITATIWHSIIIALTLTEGLEKNLNLIVQLLVLFNLIRVAYLCADAAGKWFEDYSAKTENTLDDQLAPFAAKVLKISTLTLGVLLSLQNLGFNVAAVLAGLGIGSLALALAAQDTVANLFGSITIILDRPFQRGDYIKVTDCEGTVEDVGFRSTRIRTPYRSVISIPNSTMAKEKIDNLGERSMRRFRHTIGLGMSSSAEKIGNFQAALKLKLSTHPMIDKTDILVLVTGLGDFDIKLLVNCFIITNDNKIELETQHQLILEIYKLANDMQVELAYPTQTLHVASVAKQ